VDECKPLEDGTPIAQEFPTRKAVMLEIARQGCHPTSPPPLHRRTRARNACYPTPGIIRTVTMPTLDARGYRRARPGWALQNVRRKSLTLKPLGRWLALVGAGWRCWRVAGRGRCAAPLGTWRWWRVAVATNFHVEMRRGVVSGPGAWLIPKHPSRNGAKVRRCRLPVSKPESKARMVSALDMMNRYQFLLSTSTCAATPRERSIRRRGIF